MTLQQIFGMSHTLQQRLDEYVAGISTEATLTNDLAAYCATARFSVWETLALVDQYHRQGKLPTQLYRTITRTIQHREMGFQQPAAPLQAVTPEFEVVAFTDTPEVVVVEDPAPISNTTGVATNALAAEVLSLRVQLEEARQQTARYREQLAISPMQTAPPVRIVKPSPVVATAPSTARRLHLRVVPVVAMLGSCVALAVSNGLGDPSHEALLADHLAQQAAQAPAPGAVPGVLALSASRYIAYPEDRKVEIVVQRSGGTDGEVSFEWWGQNAGARSGKDFAGNGPRRMSIPDGADSVTLSVQILNNPARRHTEMFYVVIAKPEGGATLGAAQRAPVFIMRR
jgi:hypothetical protein